ncbi:MAG: MCE family protein [Sulfurimonas sp.]|nr:MCE family protein [Sulfurimonas sp.]
MQYDKMKFSVGIFVLTFFITIGTLLYTVLDTKGTFDKRYSYRFSAQSATSLNVGMPLKFSGFDIGVIDEMKLKDDGTVSVVFSVNQENRKWITKGSALVTTKPLIGSPHIDIYPIIGNKVLEPNAEIIMTESDDINDMISKLEPAVDKILKTINNIDAITASIAKKDSNLMLSLQNVKNFTKKLSDNDSLLTSITGDKNSTNDFISSLKSLEIIMKDINKITSSLDKDLIQPSASSVKELDNIMKDIKQKLDALDSTVKVVGEYDKDLLDIKEQISVGVQKSNQLMDKIDTIMQDDTKSEVVLP